MTSIAIEKIRIDGGTQARVEINEQAVSEYADALTEGANLPEIIVFFDGADYWLADGFHRYHANRKIGALTIEADVRNGGRRDAVLFAVGANSTHGLRRTNADKRKAVETLLQDEEWKGWSDNKIAKACGVSQPFVSGARTSLQTVISDATAERIYTTKHGTQAVMKTANIGKKAEEKEEPVTPDEEDVTPELEDTIREQAAQISELVADNESMAKVFESDDRLSAAMSQITQLKAENESLRIRVNGLLNEKNEAVRMVKSLQRKLDKIEREAA